MENKSKIGICSAVLLCGIAIHYMVITMLMNDSIAVKFWKEVIILILVSYTFLRNFNNEKYLDYATIAISFFILSLLFSAIVMTKNITIVIYILRIYFIPLLVYYFSKNCSKLNKITVQSIIKYVVYFYCILCIWGIFQALILGDDFLINLGYPVKYAGRLRDSYYFGGFGDFQRVVATFANTNVFAGVIGFILIIFSFNAELFENIKKKRIKIAIMGLAFILTFSRSNWMAMITVVIFLNCRNKKILKKAIGGIILVVIVLFIISKIIDVNILEYFQRYIINTLTMQEDSAVGRITIWKEAFDTFVNNPFGIGLGKVGVLASKLTGTMPVVGESSYFAILLDTGIQGFIGFISMIILFIKGTFNYKEDSNSTKAIKFQKSVRYIIIYMLIIFMFSNHIYDLEITITAFFFIGLARNKAFMKSLKKDNMLLNN